MEIQRIKAPAKHLPVSLINPGEERDYITRMLNGYQRSIETGIKSFAAGSDCEKGYLLEKLENLKSAIEYYL